MAKAVKREAVEPVEPGAIRAGRAVAALLHVVCPLLFFTNLTRNPYYTQIALLNIGIAACGVLWAVHMIRGGEWRVPTFPFGAPLLFFLGAALISSLLSFAVHGSVRPGLAFEMTRVWVFTLINCALAVFLPGVFTRPVGEAPRRLSIWTDITLALVWGGLWFGFHEMKSPDASLLIWDTYGAFLWILAAIYAVARTRRGEAMSYFHLIFVVSLLAGGYGVLQYAGRDIIWTSPVQPYGGRPVSTFGNPNFLSSYLAMVCPLAVAFGLRSEKSDRWGYLVIAAVCGVGVLSTLTRSSYVGLLVAVAVTAAALYRPEDKRLLKYPAIALAVFVALVFLFPTTPVSNVQSPLARFTEIFDAMKTGKSYGSWHQRVLIWSSAWDMLDGWFAAFGRGWGSFELFFPFFQGKYLLIRDMAQWRTHANNAHNILLEVWSQVGIVGTGLALWGFVAMAVGGWHAARRATGASRMAAAALLGGTVGMVADNFFGNVSIFFAVPAFLFWWAVGALFHEERPPRVWTAPLGALGRPVLVAVAAVCVAGAGYYALRWKQETLYFKGFKQAKNGDLQGSIKSLEAAYRWFPGDVNSNYELGNSLSRWGRVLSERGLSEEARRADEKALKAYDAALAANPGYDEIYFNRGVTLNQLGRKEDAAASLETSIFINPILKEAYGSLGTLRLTNGEFAKGAETLEAAVTVFPKDKDLWNNLGYAYTQLGQHEKAFDAYKQAVTADPDFSRGWANLAMAARATGRKDPILEVPELVSKMEAQLKANNLNGALWSATRIAEILPNDPNARLSMGNLNFYLNNVEKAEADLKKALELDPGFAPAHANLGKMYALRRQFDLARFHMGKAIELDPSDEDTKRALRELPTD